MLVGDQAAAANAQSMLSDSLCRAAWSIVMIAQQIVHALTFQSCLPCLPDIAAIWPSKAFLPWLLCGALATHLIKPQHSDCTLVASKHDDQASLWWQAGCTAQNWLIQWPNMQKCLTLREGESLKSDTPASSRLSVGPRWRDRPFCTRYLSLITT